MGLASLAQLVGLGMAKMALHIIMCGIASYASRKMEYGAQLRCFVATHRYTFVQDMLTYWEDITSVEIISRRMSLTIIIFVDVDNCVLLTGCDIVTGPYYDSVSGNCVHSCPIGFQGIYATGACDLCKSNQLHVVDHAVHCEYTERVADEIGTTIIENDDHLCGEPKL